MIIKTKTKSIVILQRKRCRCLGKTLTSERKERKSVHLSGQDLRVRKKYRVRQVDEKYHCLLVTNKNDP